MRFPCHLSIAALLIVTASAGLGAQEGSGRSGPRGGGGGGGGIPAGGRVGGGEAMRERRDALRERMAARSGPDDRRARSEAVRDRLKSMSPEERAAMGDRMRGRGAGERARTPEQAAFAQSLREKRHELRAAVTAGTLDRRTAADQLREWLKTNRPAAPTSP